MTASTALLPSVRVAFASLVDYAGLFPPAKLSLPAAREEYLTARAGPHAWMLGRFIVPAADLAEPGEDFDAPFSAIVDPGADALNELAAIRGIVTRVEVLEIPIAQNISPFRDRLSRDEVLDLFGALEADLAVAGLRDLPAYVEIPRAHGWYGELNEMMSALSRIGLRAKLRCGGLTAQAFPSVEEVAGFIAAANVAGVAFKATAGLHHPVRHRDATTGFEMHGFLNLLAAAALAGRLPSSRLCDVVAEEDPAAFGFDDAAFSWREERVSLAELQQTRAAGFVSYGSCSFAEPVDDLTALGMLATR